MQYLKNFRIMVEYRDEREPLFQEWNIRRDGHIKTNATKNILAWVQKNGINGHKRIQIIDQRTGAVPVLINFE